MVVLGREPDAADPPTETELFGVESCSVSSASFFCGSEWQTTLAFSMHLTPDPLVACRATAPASARFILPSVAASRADPDDSSPQAFNSSPTCFPVSLLSPLSSSQVPAPKTTFAEAPSFEVCSTRYFVFHQHFSRTARHQLRGPLHSKLNIGCIVTANWRPRNCSYSTARSVIPLDWFFSHWWSLRNGLASLLVSLSDLSAPNIANHSNIVSLSAMDANGTTFV